MDGRELYKFENTSGVVGNVITDMLAANSTWPFIPALGLGVGLAAGLDRWAGLSKARTRTSAPAPTSAQH